MKKLKKSRGAASKQHQPENKKTGLNRWNADSQFQSVHSILVENIVE
jgi:hypothetical protein